MCERRTAGQTEELVRRSIDPEPRRLLVSDQWIVQQLRKNALRGIEEATISEIRKIVI